MTQKPIALACDHGGIHIMEAIRSHLDAAGIAYTDFGTHSEESVDYPMYADMVCNAIRKGESDLGILVCGTGIGMSIAANKHRGIRAACCADSFSARLTRNHNNANVLCMGERVIGVGVALELVDQFLGAEFEGGRHQKRVDMLMQLEDREA